MPANRAAENALGTIGKPFRLRMILTFQLCYSLATAKHSIANPVTVLSRYNLLDPPIAPANMVQLPDKIHGRAVGMAHVHIELPPSLLQR